MNTESNNKLSKEQNIRHWISQIQGGKSDAERKLVSMCQDFIEKVAKECEDKTLSHEDIITACESGLRLAARKFDLTKDFTFESYAVWWLKQEILQAQKRIVSSK